MLLLRFFWDRCIQLMTPVDQDIVAISPDLLFSPPSTLGVEVSSLPWHLQLQLLPPTRGSLSDRDPLPPGSVPRLLRRALLPPQVDNDVARHVFISIEILSQSILELWLFSLQPSQQTEEWGGCGHVTKCVQMFQVLFRSNKIETTSGFFFF